VPGPAACSGAENGGVAHTPSCVATQGGPRRVIRHGVARGTRVATTAAMNTTRTIESTLDVQPSTAVDSASVESPVDALATKVFAATMAYVVIFITVAVLLIAV
jgi:hypothetical protein